MLAHLRRHSHGESSDTDASAGYAKRGEFVDGGPVAGIDETPDDPYRLWVSTSPVLWNYDHALDAGGHDPAKALARN